MREQTLNIWTVRDNPKAVIGITTNGTVKSNGALVMGRGVAQQARDLYEGLDLRLGRLVGTEGNRVFLLSYPRFFTFPVKHHWKDKADLALIERSAEQLFDLASSYRTLTFYLPRPGCGNGRLRYEQVRPLLIGLPDNVVVVNWP